MRALRHLVLGPILLLLAAQAAFAQTLPPGQRILDVVLVDMPGGSFVMGDPDGEPDETPRWIQVDRFLIMRHEVTTSQFAAFVQDTGYVTDPERTGGGFAWRGGWEFVKGANWRQPFGPGSTSSDFPDHPVVQVSQRDAANFCYWARLRLPREHEWEYAARGATDQRRFPWGNETPTPQRGNFGSVQCCAPDARDGFLGSSPVGSYPLGASPFGLFDMAGNVWEWTASPAPGVVGHVIMRGGGWGNDPYAQRVSYRRTSAADVGMDMVGFRCAGDAPVARAPVNRAFQPR